MEAKQRRKETKDLDPVGSPCSGDSVPCDLQRCEGEVVRSSCQENKRPQDLWKLVSENRRHAQQPWLHRHLVRQVIDAVKCFGKHHLAFYASFPFSKHFPHISSQDASCISQGPGDWLTWALRGLSGKMRVGHSMTGPRAAQGMREQERRTVPLPCLVSDHFHFVCYSAQGPRSRVRGPNGSAWRTGALLDQGNIQASWCAAFPRLIPKQNLSAFDEERGIE